tara:strand:- start:502 stop:1218 length:717 start_codon:yes stop_codon:yes gene_type:complete
MVDRDARKRQHAGEGILLEKCWLKEKTHFSGGVRLSIEVTKSEIVDWWEDERFRITSECRVAVNAMQSRLKEQVHALDKVELIRPQSEEYDRIKARILSDLEMLSRRLHKSVGESATESIMHTERRLEEDRLSLMDGLPVFASGAAAAGSLGLAAAAMSFATTTGTFMVLIPISTVSWPLFAAFGGAAITLGYFSPSFLEWSTDLQLPISLVRRIDSPISLGLARATPIMIRHVAPNE